MLVVNHVLGSARAALIDAFIYKVALLKACLWITVIMKESRNSTVASSVLKRALVTTFFSRFVLMHGLCREANFAISIVWISCSAIVRLLLESN